MEDCIFCKIVKGEIPSYKIYEDQDFLAFLDIFPRVKGHALVIPKKHYRWVIDVPNFGEYWEITKKIAQKIERQIGASFTSFLTLGEEVTHAHIHLLPQTNNKRIEGVEFQKIVEMSKDEIVQLAKKIIL
ncbi:hypothetical protein A3F03_03460 [Candidatus Roizmanbacteria bacterium RIFCSPHIGHO2_12_FULL_41_11]|uniref:HIT domain-containing protein n=3 Tax=Candidatus Roizmaniibacteriota TaxID=1752723 RepID=A0A1F7JR39_9BACT|nr:MAG: hypothetical protein A3F03_03460 [Candidatus Roizmanbacteria bacterium RIFCSPHIGHO2_12_FULL_41_11]OGK51710.1 MAG: hypothetical protein A2966_01140 [Candidatus Roizmanbacteria bacterium RIFCSPLOWO2_01_FULL_41_22]OGK58065.1 MAG: hypothetical protein A3H86_03255 [Candidatus Roizmanbacteria bacterium RIFCSPLOWO2_02_FULL_41_9]